MSGDGGRRPSWADAHDRAEAEDRDGYVDPATGLWVFTAGFLRRRGWCCGSGCRHCPYRGDAAPPPAT